ncbi:hypothetical protein JXB12_02675 [candidate division KSB1 bacterium]|nr:hypothetical protein [candidate division KSB1 bacterium]
MAIKLREKSSKVTATMNAGDNFTALDGVEDIRLSAAGESNWNVEKELSEIAAGTDLIKHYRPSRYGVGEIVVLTVEGVAPQYKACVQCKIDKFVGGGFAGQVYRIRMIDLEVLEGESVDLRRDEYYAMKILVPPSGFSRFFRNAVYTIAYQGKFSAQVNHAAARVGVLWQKLLRRGAKIFFGTEQAIADTYATFYDRNFFSYGEINEWVSGRVWKFEIDDRVFSRKKAGFAERAFKGYKLGSFEYLAKKKFMANIVKLFHQMGAPELARQYEWSTMKSQPNVLLRLDGSENDADNLCAIDFRAGLALLPYLPMSPADFRLIFQGMLRGNLVQFDRGNLKKLDDFISQYPNYFNDLSPALEELKLREPEYRRSLPDVTHQGLKLIYSASLRRDVKMGFVNGWLMSGLIEDDFAAILNRSFLRFWMFFLLGIVPFLGRFIRRLWGNNTYARHIGGILRERSYLGRVLTAKQAARLIDWHRDGRVDEQRALQLVERPVRFWLQNFACGWLPPKWHRFLTDKTYAWDSIKETVNYPIKFYRDNHFREQWLLQQVDGGEQDGMLTHDEADHIRQRIKDPFIQKYLKCVAVHVCTLPITQVVSVIAAIYAMIRFGDSWAEGMAYAGLVLAAFQATPVSPGSLTRGSYVVYLMIKERNVRDYYIAALISFWHYIGYLGFPIQMVAKFPALSRLMAGRWATSIVHIIPVFGEKGALLEHWVFDMFFNIPISIRRWFKKS